MEGLGKASLEEVTFELKAVHKLVGQLSDKLLRVGGRGGSTSVTENSTVKALRQKQAAYLNNSEV